MGIWLVLVVAMVWMGLGWRVYGRWLARRFGLDDARPTPAVTRRDGCDFEPIPPRFLLGQHVSAIAAAGPIVGPIMAGQMFGWVPALLWILVGSVFIGGVHDFAALVASVRHDGGSIAEVVRRHVGRRAFLLFLGFLWVALVYIIVVFTDITAGAFIDATPIGAGRSVPGGAIATASLLYLALPVAMGLAMRRGLGLGAATAIFLPLVGVAIWAGPHLPFQLDALLDCAPLSARQIWCVALLGYCLVASVLPVWLLLQPRGHLGGIFLLAAMVIGGLGVLCGGEPVRWPAFTAWNVPQGGLAPILFITVACGACSGFHAIVSTGTTARQLARETDAVPVAYGGMLLEGLVAVVSLAFLMALAADSPLAGKSANFIYASGMAGFLVHLGIPVATGVAFGMLAFTTFVYDTLDVCTRLGRYIIQELTGWQGAAGRWFATALTAGVPLVFLLRGATDAQGRPVPVWKAFWGLFGASNQLLAALALLAVTVWMARTGRRRWVWPALGLPTLVMLVMSGWALAEWVGKGLSGAPGVDPRVPWMAVVLLVLAVVMLAEAARAVLRRPDQGAAGGSAGAV